MTLAATDIDALVQGCRRRQAAAQHTVVQRFAPWLMSVARRYARTKEEAEDILQDAFVQIFEKIEQFNPQKGHFTGWMQRIVVNTAISHYRRFHFTREYPTDILPDTHGALPDVWGKLSMDELIQVISTLPDGARQVFNLFVFEEYSHDEIGALLEIPAGTSRSLLSRARKILQEKITQHAHELAGI
jgi:RNA polymerase sigma factor (sigma-70 family)